MNKRICITGASGFLGSHILKPLVENGYEVFALYNTRNGANLDLDLLKEDIKWLHCNLLDRQEAGAVIADINPDYLLHFAWDVSPGYRDSLENISWMNASLNLFFQFANCSNAKKIVAAGTCFEYDIKSPCFESTNIFNFDTLYSTSKISLYNIIRQLKLPVEFAWGRIFYVYGPREHPSRLIPSIIRSILNNEEYINLRNTSTQSFPYMYVEDVANAFVSAIESSIIGSFNICPRLMTSSKLLVDTVLDLVDNSIIKPVYGTETIPNIYGLNTQLGQIGFEPSVSLQRGLMRTINWWKKELGK
jgi:nucleoside-diphosphate-sugar epimerase